MNNKRMWLCVCLCVLSPAASAVVLTGMTVDWGTFGVTLDSGMSLEWVSGTSADYAQLFDNAGGFDGGSGTWDSGSSANLSATGTVGSATTGSSQGNLTASLSAQGGLIGTDAVWDAGDAVWNRASYGRASEDFIVTGNGNVTFSVAFSGALQITPQETSLIQITSLDFTHAFSQGDFSLVRGTNVVASDGWDQTLDVYGQLTISGTVSVTAQFNDGESGYVSLDIFDGAESYYDPQPVPVPASFPLLLSGIAGLVQLGRRKTASTGTAVN